MLQETVVWYYEINFFLSIVDTGVKGNCSIKLALHLPDFHYKPSDYVYKPIYIHLDISSWIWINRPALNSSFITSIRKLSPALKRKVHYCAYVLILFTSSAPHTDYLFGTHPCCNSRTTCTSIRENALSK